MSLDTNSAGLTVNAVVTPQIPKAGNVGLPTTANTNYTAPVAANVVLAITAGPKGGRLNKLKFIPCATVTATQIQCFRSLDGGEHWENLSHGQYLNDDMVDMHGVLASRWRPGNVYAIARCGMFHSADGGDRTLFP